LEEQRSLVLAEVGRGALGAQGDDLGDKDLQLVLWQLFHRTD
jgi:hypothetical protein